MHHDALPALFVDQIHLATLGNRVTSIVFAVSVVALVVLWRRRKSVLDLWLIVSVCALVAELAVTTFVITSRASVWDFTHSAYFHWPLRPSC